jgi:pilus assembly protein TadC
VIETGRSTSWTILATFFLLTLAILPSASLAADGPGPKIRPVYPKANETIYTISPLVRITYSDPSGIKTESVTLVYDRIDVSNWEETRISAKEVRFAVPKLLKMSPGNHTIIITVENNQGIKSTLQYNFTRSMEPAPSNATPVDLGAVAIWTLAISLAVAGGVGGYVQYIRKKKRFTFRKFFIRNPLQREYFIFYIPAILAFFVVLLGMLWVSGNPRAGPFDTEYVIIAGFFIAVLGYAYESQIERRRVRRFEASFAQLLFEMADAIRSGIDPAKAITELSTTNTGPYKRVLAIAADNVRLGRPFEEVMKGIAAPAKSALVDRYASLIGEASKIGGDISLVLHIAARDMDDFLKISEERTRQLMMQATTIYIAFSVLLAIIYLLLKSMPQLASINLGILGTTSLESGSAAANLGRMTVLDMERRFFHLTVICGIGSGLLIGKLSWGKIRYGLMHAMALTGAAVVVFAFMIL